MNIRRIAPCILATALVAPAQGDLLTLGGSVVRQKSRIESTGGSSCPEVVTADCAFFGAVAFDNRDGTSNANIFVVLQGPATSGLISCEGPDSVQLSVSRNGITIVVATLDPSSQDCLSFGVTAPVTVNLVGQPNGQLHQTNTGAGTEEDASQTTKLHFVSEGWQVTLNGSIGSITGPFTGNSDSFRSTTRVKE
jgi:hypothetical protein